MARTNTRPQATKPRYDDLDTFGRRDGSVRYRDAGYHFKKDPRQVTFAARILKNDWSAAFADHEPNDLDDWDDELDQPLFDEEDWDFFVEEDWGLFDEEKFYDEEEIDPDEFVDHGAYGTYRGVHTLQQGFSLDAVFGEGYRGGNCGFSVTTHP